MRTREFRRFNQFTKVKRRIELYASINWLNTSTREEFRQEVKKGNCNWIRTTSTPCSCFICSCENKYKRKSKVKIDKLIKQQLE